MRGCLKQSSGNWVVSQNGQETTLSGDSSMLKPHDGQQVEVHGAQSGGTLRVTSVNTISDACTGGGQGVSTASVTLPQGCYSSSDSEENIFSSGVHSAVLLWHSAIVLCEQISNE